MFRTRCLFWGVCPVTFNKASRRHKSFRCFRGGGAGPCSSTQLLLFCQELLCFPEKRKSFHFHLLCVSECERRSFSNIQSIQISSPSEPKYTNVPSDCVACRSQRKWEFPKLVYLSTLAVSALFLLEVGGAGGDFVFLCPD